MRFLRNEKEVIIAHKNVVIEPEDHVIIFLADKNQNPSYRITFCCWYWFLLSMQFRLILSLLGLLVTIFSLTMLMPAVVGLLYGENDYYVFLMAFGVSCITGSLVWGAMRGTRGELRTRDGFLITTLFWIVLGLFGSLPLFLHPALELSFTDAIFESISGLTTTGSTVIVGLDDLPHSLLFYRQQLQWLGGIGIIVIAIAILPMLGIGGMQLFKAETPGPMKDNKLTPRIAGTAKLLFYIYLAMTIACALCYWAAGMSLFDAVCHSFSTVAIGGFSTHDASMAYFDSNLILWIGILFMMLAGVNFGLHYFAFRNLSLQRYQHDPELKFFYSVIGLSTLLIAVTLIMASGFKEGSLTDGVVIESSLQKAFSNEGFDQFTDAAFQVVSFASTTGFTSTDYTVWPTVIMVFMFYLAFVGACAGSTGGGIKVIRVILIFKQAYRELLRLVHPSGNHFYQARRPASKRLRDKRCMELFLPFTSWCFFALFLAILLTGMDFLSAFAAVGASINNLGPGLGDVAANYTAVSDPAKWILCFAMLTGRLEVFYATGAIYPCFLAQISLLSPIFCHCDH